LDECAWIEAGNLCVPRFHSRGEMGSTLGVYDLGNGEELWRMGFGDDEHFYAVARYAGQSYLVIHSSALKRGQSRGAVYSLDLNMRRIRSLESIRPNELSAGLSEGRTTELEAPYLFFVPMEGNAQSVPLRVIQLDTGVSRSVRLPVPQAEFYPDDLPTPVVSESFIAIAFRVQDPDTQLVSRTRLEFIGLDSEGRPTTTTPEGQVLAQASGGSQAVKLIGFGTALYVLHGRTNGAARLDTYGPLR
ncbi:MAG: hypothetical protein ACI8QS_000343, partial [Planctomycetota bacterium]